MTDLYNGKITHLLGGSYAYDPDIRAVAYAILLEKQRLMDLAQTTRTMAMIDQLPEAILDVLAVELRTPYYTADLAIEEKRNIIKSTLVWFFKSGTPSAVAEMIQVIFGGGGYALEWFDPMADGLDPGEFDIVADAEMQDPVELMARILPIIERVKNVRSHLRKVMFYREATAPVRPAAMITEFPVVPIHMTWTGTREATAPAAGAAHPESFKAVTISNIITRTADAEAPAAAGAHPESASYATIQS